MTLAMRIGLLGFGEVGQILGQDLPIYRVPNLAFDLQFETPNSRQLIAQKQNPRTERSGQPSSLGCECDIVISAVTAENTEAAAHSVSADLKPNSWFLDLNSSSPETKKRTALLINKAGGRYVEAAVMSPVPPKRLGSPILLGGPYAKAFLDTGTTLGFSNLSVFSESYGTASAAKMCRSVMIKGMEALLTESLVTARAYGVEQTVLASLNDLFPGPDWPTLSGYMIGRALEHGGRRAEEMREVAKTVAHTGLNPSMSVATVLVQDWAKRYPEFQKLDALEATLDALGEAARQTPLGDAA
ncbi:MAG: DUF1932 domain-containing protein [Henriciella sp.]